MKSAKKLERRLAAIMFTDIADYTALSAKDSRKALQLLDKQNEIVKPILSNHKGNLLKEMGDGLLITFESATSAVECAIEIQKQTKDIDGLNLRIGIHEGEVALKDGDIFGDDVNIASRIEPFSAIGGVAISHKIQQAISSNQDFKTEYVGKPKLKGVSQAVEVYCIISHGLPKTDKSKISAKLEKSNNYITAIMGGIFITIGLIFWLTVNVFNSQDEVPSVGILLMENLGKEEDLFWARGITEDLIIKIAGAGLIRVSPMKDIKNVNMNDEFISIGKQLRVKYLLTSSIYKHEEGFDLRCQLIEAESGNSKYANKWSEKLEKSPTIVGSLAQNIIQTLNVKTKQDISVASTENPEAYEYYLKAKYKWDKRTTIEDTEIVRGMLKKAIELSPNLLLAINLLGETYSSWGSSEFDKAIEIFTSTINYSDMESSKSEIAKANQSIAYIYLRKGQFEQALNSYFESLHIYTNINDKLGISTVLNEISQVYERLNNIDKTIEYLNKSLAIATELDDKLIKGKVITNLGLVYIKQGDYENALINFNSALKITQSLQIKFGEAILMVNIGNAYNRMGDYDNGFESVMTSYKISEELGFKYVTIYSAFAIGKVLADQGKFEDALAYFEQVEQIQKETSMKDLILENTIYLNFTLKQIKRDYTTKGIMEIIDNIYYPIYEVYYPLYLLINNKDYLEIAYNNVIKNSNELNNVKKEKFLNYPLQKQIIEEYKKVFLN